jgi:transposase-like protein
MGRPRNPHNPACLRCGATQTVRKGRHNERSRWRCLAWGRSFGETLGTPLYRLKTDLPEIIRAIQVVLHRGSLRAADEQTGHNNEKPLLSGSSASATTPRRWETLKPVVNL